MTQPVEISGRTFHLRATMGALRAAKEQHGIDISNMGTDPLDVVVLCYHFAVAGAAANQTELKMTAAEFEQIVTPADLPAISVALEKVMTVNTGKKK